MAVPRGRVPRRRAPRRARRRPGRASALGGIVESALSHLPFLHVHSPLSSLEEAILWQIRAPRVVARRARRRDARDRRLVVSGRLPQSARRSVPARRRGRRRARRDARDRVRPRRHVGPAPAARARSSAALVAVALHVRARPLGGRGARDRRARARGRDGRRSFLTAHPDVRAAAAHEHAARRLLVAPRRLLDGELAARSRVAAPYVVVSSLVILLHRRVLDVLSVGDEEAASLGVNVAPRAAAGRRRRDRRHGGGGLGERADRLRRDHRPAHDPAARLDELPRGRAALARRRRRLPRARRRASRARSSRPPSCRSASSPRSSARRSSRSSSARSRTMR